MNWIFYTVLIGMIVLRLAEWRRLIKINMLAWLAVWLGGLFVAVHWGFTVPVPISVQKIYMGIAVLALAAYVLTDRDRLRSVSRPLVAFMTEPRYRLALAATVLLIPALVAYQVYAGMTKEPSAPSFPRSVHPASPSSITVHDEQFNLDTLDNPYRPLQTRDPEAFAEHVEDGRRVYYENCFYCHGDLLSGEGMFAHGLNPIPTNFQDGSIIPILQEGFLFWRIAKGGPGLPDEGGPWDSAMPAWESFLTEDEIWNVILFLSDFTGYPPRPREDVHE
jgi:mono/diheme cytochrome c family protein